MDSLLIEGNRAYQSGDLGRAVDCYQEAALRVPFMQRFIQPNLDRARAGFKAAGCLGAFEGVERLHDWQAHGIHRLAGCTPAEDSRATVVLVGHVSGYPAFGAERSLIDMARAAWANGFCNVQVCLPSFDAGYVDSLRPYVSSIFVHDYGWWEADGERSAAAAARFALIFRRVRARLVHVNTIMPWDAVLAARASAVPVMVHAREILQQDPYLLARLGRDADQLVERVVAEVDWLVCNSAATQQAFGSPGHSVVLPNALDVDAFAGRVTELEQAKPDARGKLVVGLISSNVEKKGVADFFELAAAAVARNWPLRFELIGPANEYVEGLLARYQSLADSGLYRVGYLPDPAEAVARLDLVCNFSHFAESFGRTVLEGMAAGRAALVYDHGALPELLDPGVTGWVLPYRRPLAALEVLERLCTEPAQCRAAGASAQARARALFDLPGYERALAALYQRAMKISE